jgi:hypothetical protein
LPYRKALAGHDFGFGDVREENTMNENTKKLLAGNDIYEEEVTDANKNKQKPCKTKKGCKRCEPTPAEKVNNPTHYNTGKIEVIDAIEDWGLGFNDGNAIKYIARHKHKDDSVQDIEKAIWYLQRHLKNLRSGVLR